MRTLVLASLLALCGAARADVHGAPLPRGAKKLDEARYLSPKGFKATVAWYKKELSRRGVGVTLVPAERVRGIVYARILATDVGATWQAIHIVLAEGKTTIYIVGPKTVGDRLTAGRMTLDHAI